MKQFNTLFLLLPIFLFSIISVSAQSTTFSGTTGDWNNLANWTNGIPTASLDVIINGATRVVTIPAGYIANAKSVSVFNGASLTIAQTASLQVQNTNNCGVCITGLNASLDNHGTIQSNTNIGERALQIANGSSLTNHATGTINLDNTGNQDAGNGDGIWMTSSSLSNSGHINIGPNLTNHGIYFTSGTITFTNTATGQINILGVGPDASDDGIHRGGGAVTLTNNGVICINETDITGNGGVALHSISVGPTAFQANGCTATMAVQTVIPTLGQWAMIVLALLMGVMATLVMQARRRLATTSPSNVGSRHVVTLHSIGHLPFDGKTFAKTLAIVFGVVIAIFAIAIAAFGYEMTEADIPGALIAVPVAAYLIFLLKE